MRYALMPAAVAAALLLPAPAALAAKPSDVELLRQEVMRLRGEYEKRIADLEHRLKTAEGRSQAAEQTARQAEEKVARAAPPAPVKAAANSFNPGISLVLSGGYNSFSQDPGTYRLGGFKPNGGEIAPGERGFNLSESELSISASVDPYFKGAMTLAVTPENETELEEAFIQSTALPGGFTLKAGRFLSSLGYLNDKHAHAWDFIDAPLAYKAFWGGQYGDDGVQVRWLAPVQSVLFEVGAEAGRGRGFPGSDRNKNGAATGVLFARLGGDAGKTASWQIGGSYLHTNPQGLSFDDTDTTTGNATTNTFSGRSKTWLADAVFKWAPTGNARQQQLSLHGAWMLREEGGSLSCDDADATAPTACTGGITDSFSSRQSGGYAEAVYRFAPQWRFGYRHDRLDSGTVNFGAAHIPAAFLSLQSHDPKRDSFLLDFSPSEYSKFRLQFAQDHSRPGVKDNQIWLQYQMSLGTHPAHVY
jgi:hypothetical protein